MSTAPRSRSATDPLVLTANRLADGRVVWLGSGGDWSEQVAEARIFAPGQRDDALAEGAAAERARIVVGAYAVEVALRGGTPCPLRLRERLRMEGPSVDAVPRPAFPLKLAS
jgi:hypothetical protein